jgi:hypothetical protein
VPDEPDRRGSAFDQSLRYGFELGLVLQQPEKRLRLLADFREEELAGNRVGRRLRARRGDQRSRRRPVSGSKR